MSPSAGGQESEKSRVAVLGLGEAGSRLATDLTERGLRVVAFDPAERATPPRVDRAESEEQASEGARVVLSVNSASAAVSAAEKCARVLRPDQIFADLNTASPEVKRRTAQAVEASGCTFADVALMAPIRFGGIATPALASGEGANDFKDFFAPLGMPVTVIGEEVGSAATRKLLRSIFMKGLAISVTEALRTADAVGAREWLHAEIAGTLEAADGKLLQRLIDGSVVHAGRRREEMEAAAALEHEVGIEAHIARACSEWFSVLDREFGTTPP
jgi:3-hydroxyisobutyrate dehydrogenase-like beta-hydroxyacid dehydrogenase